MTLVWESPKQIRKDIDPIADWIGTIETDETKLRDGWRPRSMTLHIPLALSPLIGALVEAVRDTILPRHVVLEHDLAHFLRRLFITPVPGKGIVAELIYFMRVTDNEDIYDKDRDSIKKALFEAVGASPDDPELEDLVTLSGAGAIIANLNRPPREFPGRDNEAWIREITRTLEGYNPQPHRTPSNIVVLGVIDHEVPVAHTRLQRPFASSLGKPSKQTRVRKAWAQAIGDEGNRTGPGQVVQGYEIDKAKGKFADDEEVYKELKLINRAKKTRVRGEDLLGRSWTHGGHVVDLVAGRDLDDSRERKIAKRTELITVQLPTEIVATTNGFLHELFVKSAMNFIWWMGFRRHRERPIIVNYSYGDASGRHDGWDILDYDFSQRLKSNEIAHITTPVGNGFVSDMHLRLAKSKLSNPVEFSLAVQPDGREPAFLQLWLDGWYSTNLPISLEIAPPGGAFGPAMIGVDQTVDLKCGIAPVARIYSQIDRGDKPAEAGGAPQRTRVTLAIRPTAWDDPKLPTAPVGRWRIRIKDISLASREVLRIWVERGDSLPGFPPRGRQAYLEHPEHVVYDGAGRLVQTDSTASPIKRFGSAAGAAGGENVDVVAAWRGGPCPRIAYYSAGSEGSSVTPPYRRPSLSVQAEHSDVRPNCLTAGVKSGSTRMARGTSMASALFARYLTEEALGMAPGWKRPLAAHEDPRRYGGYVLIFPHDTRPPRTAQ